MTLRARLHLLLRISGIGLMLLSAAYAIIQCYLQRAAPGGWIVPLFFGAAGLKLGWLVLARGGRGPVSRA